MAGQRVMRVTASGGKPEFTGLSIGNVIGNDTLDVSPDGTRLVFAGQLQSTQIVSSAVAR